MVAGWEYGLAEAIDEITHELRISKGALARALGFPNYLSPSNLNGLNAEARYSRVCGALHAANLPQVAARLGVLHSQYPRLEKFFRAAVKRTMAWDVDPVLSRGDLRETIDWGYVGVELFNAARWDEALPYLERSWQRLREQPHPGSDMELHTLLRVGTQLVSLDGYVGQTDRTRRMLNELGHVARAYLKSKKGDRDILEAIGEFYTGAAVAYRLFGVLSPLDVVGYSRMAFDVLASSDLSLSRQIGALRDQAKPLVRAGLNTPGRDTGARIGEALAVLTRADQLAGGAVPREDLREAWLFTRGTLIDCLAVTGRRDEARRIFDETLGNDWVDKLIDQRKHTPLKSKIQVSHMAVSAAGGELDDLAIMAEAFPKDPRNARYVDRMRKVAMLEQYAANRDIALFHDAILG